MNWTASLLRNQLKKQKETYENRLNLLTNASLGIQNYLELETRLNQLRRAESNLAIADKNLTDLKKQVENKEQLISYQRDNLEKDNQDLKTQHQQEISAKDKELRDYQLYHQREIKRLKTDYQTQLQSKTAQLQDENTNQQRELKERGKLIALLEEQAKESQKELDFANSKIKQLNPLFNQVLGVIKKNVILRGKKDLKEAIALIQELMNWEKSPLVTETNTPTGEEE